MLNAIECLELASMSVIGSLAQLCLKMSSRSPKKSFAFFSLFGIGGGLLACNTVFFAWILKSVPLGMAMPFTAIVYILVPLGATIFLKEEIAGTFWIGASLIALGISVASL